MYIIGRLAVLSSSRAIGRSWILCMPRMPTCGVLRIGVDMSDPNTPPLVMVKVPPCSSGRLSVLARALEASSPIRRSISGKLRRSASRTTGTTRPSLADTAMPMS
ncbi:hypothetical protein D3C74_369750 [compost metagenome]